MHVMSVSFHAFGFSVIFGEIAPAGHIRFFMVQTSFLLSANQVRRVANPQSLRPLVEEPIPQSAPVIGQERALKALHFGLDIHDSGFNIYVSGLPGTGKLTAVTGLVRDEAAARSTPFDWCYVNNFRDPGQPRRLRLPAGRAVQLRADVRNLVSEIRQSLLRTFESEQYAEQRKAIIDAVEERQHALFQTITEKAAKRSLVIKQTPWEVITLPMVDGKAMSEKAFKALDTDEQQRLLKKQLEFQDEVKAGIRESRKLEKEANEALHELEQRVARQTISNAAEETEDSYADVPEVLAFLAEIKEVILDNLSSLLPQEKETTGIAALLQGQGTSFLDKFEVNVLIDHSETVGAPVVFEQNPTYNNLFGRVEKESTMGTLYTDFTLIRQGSLHRANGGYLILQVEDLFHNLFSYDGLKRALKNKEIVIEEAGDQFGWLTSKTLKPEPIPLEVKVILTGDPLYYHLLWQHDPEFRELFKVKADFDSSMDRNESNIREYAGFVHALAGKEQLPRPDESALARIIEAGSRMAEDQNKLSTRFGILSDLIRESAHYAREEGTESIQGIHVNRAIREKAYRSGLLEQKLNEMVLNGQLRLDSDGECAGQINALSVIDLGDVSFGRPNRITCSVHLGKEGVIAIEREARLSGKIHTKGVMILTGYLTQRFNQADPVSLSASIVFEQSYSEVEGDSASCAELIVILSALSGVPIRQGIAVTGSINQKGEVQAIGGVNEKIEGYFEVCRLMGLNGSQGVIIPASNVRNLMLKEEVVDAVVQQKFSIWAVNHVEEAVEVLTGIPAGSEDQEGSVYCKVDQALKRYATRTRESSGKS